MKQTRTLVALAALGIIGAAQSQVFIPLPFPPTISESFNAIPLGSVPNFIGYGGMGQFSRIGVGGLLHVTNNPLLLPPIAGNAMFGRGVDVRIRYTQVWKQWGGWFRVPNAGVPVTQMKVQFFRFGVPVGVAVVAPINNAAWQWRGWDCGPIGGYDAVEIYGNAVTIPGYVGMEDLRSR